MPKNKDGQSKINDCLRKLTRLGKDRGLNQDRLLENLISFYEINLENFTVIDGILHWKGGKK